MTLQVILFAGARELAGRETLAIDVASRPRAADVLAALARAEPGLAPLLPSCRIAVDRQYVGDETVIDEGSEVALIPPVSGG